MRESHIDSSIAISALLAATWLEMAYSAHSGEICVYLSGREAVDLVAQLLSLFVDNAVA